MGLKTLDVGDYILKRLPRETQLSNKTPLPSNEDPMVVKDEIQDLVETLREFRLPNPVEVRTAQSQFDGKMLQHSLPFTEMKEDLRRFVFPSMKSYIREKVLPLLPSTNLVSIHTVTLYVHWELEEYLDRDFDANDVIDDMLTLTGEVPYAQGLPCAAYVKQSWPRTGAATLAAIKSALQRGKSCEYPQSSLSAIHFSGSIYASTIDH